jgi:tetratricopeptide (TPR) repeat protein
MADLDKIKAEIAELNKQIESLKNIDVTLKLDGVKESLKQLKSFQKAIEGYEKEIAELKKIDPNADTTELDAELKKYKEAADALKGSIREKGGVFNSLKNEMKDAASEIEAFTYSFNAIYETGQNIAKSYYQLNKTLGATGQLAKTISFNFKDALPDIIRMGGSAEDLAEAYGNFAEQSGRQNVLSSDTLKNMLALSKATGLAEAQAGEMYERFNLMGVSMTKTHETLTDLINGSNKLGLNSTKVIKVLSGNLDSMQRMSFRGGVKAMTEMAKLAVQMRMDVSDMLNMADKFYEPEAAIEAAAQLQLMGGDIAQAFGDPFETMYLARNKPEELAKKLQTMTENMLEFNEVTGQYDLPAEARQQLQFAAEQLGVAEDKMIDLAIQSSKIKDIKMDVSGNITDDDMRETLAGMAQMKDGRWVVDVGGEQIDIADITQEQADKLKAFSDENIMKTQAQATMTNTEAILAQTEAIKADIAVTTNLYRCCRCR